MKKLINYLTTVAALLVFIVFTILVKTIDVQYIPDVGYLGFYSLNTAVNQSVLAFARSETLDKVTDIGLYLSFGFVLAFAVVGLVQLIKRKSFKEVDPIIYVLLATYVIAVAMYFIFEIVKINYSPLSVKDELKASYPSSHILFFSTFVVTGMITIFHYLDSHKVIKLASICIAILVSITFSVARLYSGQHYLSDVIGSILLSLAIILLFIALKKDFCKSVEA